MFILVGVSSHPTKTKTLAMDLYYDLSENMSENAERLLQEETTVFVR